MAWGYLNVCLGYESMVDYAPKPLFVYPMKNVEESLFIRALKRQPVEKTPVWIMRQAGRYLPEYRAVRSQAGSFMNLCQTPELACEVTLQPLRRYDLDAAILFSDILTIPDAMGLGLYFKEGEGPGFERPLQSLEVINQLQKPDIDERLDYVFQAAKLIRENMPQHLPLIGFSGSPFTLACYMIEGKSSRDFKTALKLMYQHPSSFKKVLSILQASIYEYLVGQIKAGVNVVMLFDTWGGLLSTECYRNFSLQYMQEIIARLKANHPEIPVILFTKGGGQWLEQIAHSGCDAVGLDWTVDLSRAKNLIGDQVALQGNLDPSILCTNAECIREQVALVLRSFGSGPGHIFNLGHGITPDVPPENVKVLVDAVHELSGQ